MPCPGRRRDGMGGVGMGPQMGEWPTVQRRAFSKASHQEHHIYGPVASSCSSHRLTEGLRGAE